LIYPSELERTPYAGEVAILLHIFGKFMILKLKSSRLSKMLVLS
jgi:hypothetical protein